jgi:hypothetical protein
MQSKRQRNRRRRMWQHDESRKRMTGSSSVEHMRPMHLLQVPSHQRASQICRRLRARCPFQRTALKRYWFVESIPSLTRIRGFGTVTDLLACLTVPPDGELTRTTRPRLELSIIHHPSLQHLKLPDLHHSSHSPRTL